MCQGETNSSSCAELISIDAIAELLLSAECEVASFYRAIRERYGPEQAGLAFQDWLSEVEVIDWPSEGQVPDWRQCTIGAVAKLAARLAASGPPTALTETT